MVPVLQILACVGFVQSIDTTVGTIYLALNRVRTAFYFGLFVTPLFICAFVIGLQWSIVGVAAGYALAELSVCYISLYLAFSHCGIRFRDFHAALARPFAATLVMLVVVMFLVNALASAGLPTPTRLAFCIAAGVVTYCAASLLINRKHLLDVLATARSAFT